MTTRELQIGDRVRDNEAAHSWDKLVEGVVATLYDEGVDVSFADGGEVFILRSRIHLDDKPRKTGWSRV